jgi:hypothetical protein
MRRNFILILILISNYLYSNGGPIDWTLLLRTGNIEFINQSGFRIDEEHINFLVDGDFTDVTVNYKITNTNSNERSITYAFPVDVYSEDGEYSAETLSEEVSNFQIFDNETALNYNISDKTERITFDYPEIYSQSRNVRMDAVRIYYTSNFIFRSNEEKFIQVKYRAKNQYLNLLFTKSIIPDYSDRLFFYNLEPSKNWGNGMVKDFSYTIDFTKVNYVGGKPVALPDGGELEESIYRFAARDFNLNSAKNIMFTYDIRDYLISCFFIEKRLTGESIKSITASSTLDPDCNWSYDVENLIDLNFETVWVEGVDGSGSGESVEIELENFNVGYIGIINGFNHSEELYKNNSRALKIKYEIELDPEGPYSRSRSNTLEGEAVLNDIGYQEITVYNFSTFTQRIFNAGDAGVPVKKIRITILNAIDGEKFTDLCLSEIVILGYTYEELQ